MTMCSLKNLVVGVAAAVALVTGATGCSSTPGSGIHRSETRSVAKFDEIDLTTVDAQIVVDESAPGDKIEITGDDNLVPLVRIAVDGRRLVVKVDDEIDRRLPLSLVIRAPRITRLDAVSSDVSLEVKADTLLTVNAAGDSHLTVRGSVARLDANLAGKASLEARELSARDVEIDAAGSSSASVCATANLDADVAGESDVRYYCNPVHVDRDVDGEGTFVRM
jgi:hypothetical protein